MKYLLTVLTAVFCFWPGHSMGQEIIKADSRFCFDHDGQDVAGFKLVYGTASNVYDQEHDLGMALIGQDVGRPQSGYCTPTRDEMGLPEGITHWNVVAYDASGNVSGPDGEVVSIPLDRTPPSGVTNLTHVGP